MSYLYIVYTSTVSIVVLFLLCKLTGNKQISELSMFDYINSITIGSIAAEAATALDKNFTHCLLAMGIYGLFAYGISYLCSRFIRFNRFISGRSIPLVCMDKIYYKNLKRARLDVSELLTQLRCQGYFDIKDVAYAYLETNGNLSVLPRECARPANAKDVKAQSPEQTRPAITLVTDGVFLNENIKTASVTKERILKEAAAKGCKSENDILLATCDSKGNISIYVKDDIREDNDPFQ